MSVAATACSSCGLGFGMSGGGSLTGGQKGKKLESDKKTDLYKKAQKYGIKGRSKMNKNQLVQAVRSAQKKVGDAIARRGNKKSGVKSGSPKK